MTTENKIDRIKSLIEKATEKFGGHENIALLCAAFHGCHPGAPSGWEAEAVQIDGNRLSHGCAIWDFSEYDEQREKDGFPVEDAGDYNWDDCDGMGPGAEEFDLSDEDDCDEVIKIIENAIK